MKNGKRWLSNLVVLSSLAWSGAAHANFMLWYLAAESAPESTPKQTQVEVPSPIPLRRKAEDCGTLENTRIPLSVLASKTTVVLQDTGSWLLRDSLRWCNSELGRSRGSGLFKGITYVRKDPEVAFYVIKSGSLVAVPWGAAKDKAYMPEILDLVGKSEAWHVVFNSIWLEVNRREKQQENEPTDRRPIATGTPK